MQGCVHIKDVCHAVQGVREELMVSTIAPAVRPLVSDRTPAVKEQCFAALAGWLGASG